MCYTEFGRQPRHRPRQRCEAAHRRALGFRRARLGRRVAAQTSGHSEVGVLAVCVIGVERERLEERLMVDQLLGHHTRDTDHREAAVAELLGLHGRELLGTGGFEAERIEANVARVISRAQLEEVAGARLHPAAPRAPRLRHADRQREQRQHGPRDLLQLVVGRTGDLAAPDDGRGPLADEVAHRCDHGDAAVLHFGFAVAPHVVQWHAIPREADRVKRAHRSDSAGQAVAEAIRLGHPSVQRRADVALARLDARRDRRQRRAQVGVVCGVDGSQLALGFQSGAATRQRRRDVRRRRRREEKVGQAHRRGAWVTEVHGCFER
mmetsp:Transcript_2970/g.10656  ORF Transcript_2970/g.10656 Transcript_2970/m.10656 type:complete len:322 (+) Transcript_2970:47-1012(+)|eukprot:CAMPEP_0184259670 /NCGR_PEP_ID=MMETSP0977-20130417/12159_1 /TAXON_ID=483370 /ORGANISM="non described non described, Strain CCMP2097" /LENGTH=321 /DNA_ID=CAMNT_0026565325 /DNA_START=19 /DNA_END=984 /DNA_ORIENTATION=-